jgi:3-oxoacyl-[acyl-carrier protein] reductase
LGELERKIALITGASRGIGAACALVMAREGADIVVNYKQSQTLANEVAEQVRSLGRRALVIQADVSDSEQVTRMVDRVFAEWGRVDILVNNAGKHYHLKFEEMTLQEWHTGMDTNLTSQVLCSQAVVPSMRKQKWGRIINLSALSAQRGSVSGDVSYGCSKAGSLGLARSLFRSLANDGVTINAICPGPIWTDMLKAGFTPERLDQFVKNVPMHRMGKPEEIAEVVSFLASDRASYITGQTISVNGGLWV